MSNVAVKIEGLYKSYMIARERDNDVVASYSTLREGLSNMFKFKGRLQKEEFWALQDINLTIEKGEKIALIGRNGAGKSTLLKVLSGITEPTKGKATIYGRVSSLLEVGTGFHPELTGRENIYLNGSILGMTHAEIKRKFDQIVDFSGCERFLDTPVKRYSSGMRVRLGFAVAAYLESEILIVDEVLAVGDAEFQKKCLGKMDNIAKSEGRTIVFVSHNMAAIQTLCERGVLIEDGRVSFVGGVDETTSRYFSDERKYSIIDSSKEISNFASDCQISSDGKIKIKFEFDMQQSYEDVFCDLEVYNNSRHKLYRLRVSDVSGFMNLRKGHHEVSFYVENINLLSAGRYYGKIMIATRGKKDILFHIDDLLLFEIDGVSHDGAILKGNFKVEGTFEVC